MRNEEIKINLLKKMGFLKRIQVSIFKVENYSEFLLEKTNISIKYLLKLILLVAVILAISTTVQINKIASKGLRYIKNEMPEFSLIDGEISFKEDTEGYDNDLDFYVKYSTKSELSDSIVSEIKKDVQQYSSAFVYLKDRIIIYNGGNYSVFKYSDLLSEYNLSITNRTDLINLIDKLGITGIDISFFIISFLSGYVTNIINVIFDVSLVFCFGIIASRICGVNMPYSKMISLSIYSLTLSIFLSLLYSVVYNFTNFYIEYFEFMYIIVAYIYLIAAILIIKSDVIKQKMELQKIIEVQNQVKKEIEEQKKEESKEDNKKDDNKEEKKKKKDKNEEEPIIDREPDGSEI
ncbi:MAG: DUF1189 family protein [Clostridia bacterium]|nr:DUF1189 family protein [Clostridia bacterium]